MDKQPKRTRSDMGFIVAIGIGLIIGVFIKKVHYGLIIGLALGLLGAGLLKRR